LYKSGFIHSATSEKAFKVDIWLYLNTLSCLGENKWVLIAPLVFSNSSCLLLFA